MKSLVPIIRSKTKTRVQPYAIQMAALDWGDICYFANTWLHKLMPIGIE